MEFLIQLAFFFTLLLTGFLFGRRAEKKHYASIAKRHTLYKDIAVFNHKDIPAIMHDNQEGHLVFGSVVVGQDYFKLIASALRGFFGGNLSSYETLIDRARKEAILRMKEQAHAMQADMVFNIKIETSSIGKGTKKQSSSVEVFAYGTALRKPSS